MTEGRESLSTGQEQHRQHRTLFSSVTPVSTEYYIFVLRSYRSIVLPRRSMSSLSLRCIVVFLQILVGMWLGRNPNKRSMSFEQIKVLPLHRIDIATKELVMYSIWCCNSECPRGYRCRLTAIFRSGALQIQFCNFVGSPKISEENLSANSL